MLYKPLSRKVTFPVTSKPTPPTVFNLQALDYVHCEEETGVHTGISRRTSKFLYFFLQIFKVVYFAKKNMCILKNSIKFIILFFFKRDITVYIYIY